MSRKSIYDILEEKVLDPTVAFTRIMYQFNHVMHTCNFNRGYPKSLKTIVDNYLFEMLTIKGSCVNLDDLMNDIGIVLTGNKKTFDDVFRLSEFILCIIDSIPKDQRFLINEGYDETIFDKIEYTIMEILKKTNYKIAKDKHQHRIIVSYDSKVELAAELANDNDVSLELIAYNHYSNNGNIKEKKRILKELGDYIEPMLKKQSNNNLKDDISFLLNNFDIRHNNRVGANERDYIVKMADDDLEKWYDKTYSAIVAFIINNELSSLHKDLKQFKK